jgi:UDP-N-acetylmuramate dehydrogenase
MINISEIYKELKRLKSLSVHKNEPLSRHTTIKTGGPADLLLVPKNIETLQDALNITRGIKKYIIGNGSNILVSDKGVNGIVFKIAGGMNDFENNGRFVTAGAGILLQNLIHRLTLLGLSGLEYAAWVPAALGGAIATNMGAFGHDIGSLIEYVDIINESGKREKLCRSDLSFSYRKSNIRNCIITSVMLKLTYKQKHVIKRMIKEFISKRRELQPISVPSSGSVFKNPKDVPAGKLIDMAGCKGLRIGGAEVSKKHANFIINLGDAKSGDIIKLINKVKSIVKSKFKVNLELELIDSNQLNMLF